MKMNSPATKRITSLVVATLIGGSPLLSAAIITPLEHDASEWRHVRSGGDTIVELSGGKLMHERPAPPEGGTVSSTGGISFWKGSSSVAGELGDFSGSVILSANLRINDAWGVVVGAQNTTFTSVSGTNHGGYYIGLVPGATDQAGLHIWYNQTTKGSTTDGSSLVSNRQSGVTALPIEDDYLLEFSVSGKTIHASLWGVDDSGNKTGGLLADVSYTAAADITGYFGLETYRLGNTASRTFSDLKLDVIPEPGSVALLGGLAICVAGQRLFRRR